MSLRNDVSRPRLPAAIAPASVPSIELRIVERCPVCGVRERKMIRRGPDRMHHLPGEFTLVQCAGCGLVYQSPRPAPHALDRLYPDSYEPFQPLVAEAGYIPRDLRRTAEFVNALRPGGGRLLDIGCGVGDFLLTMRRLFPAWQLAGIEPSAHAAAFARGRGLDVRTGTFDNLSSEDTGLDVITLWNVLEHLPDPLACLRDVDRRLAPGGLLCLAIPVRDSWEARIFGGYWVGWELPRHFYLFDRRTIARTLAAAGLCVVREACVGGTAYGVTRSADLLLEDRVRAYGPRRIAERSLRSVPLRALIKLYSLLAERARRGTVLTIAARRADEVGR